jgi:DNA modification methylase
MSNHRYKVLNGPAEKRLDEIADQSIDCCFTSPPPFGQGAGEGLGSYKSIMEYGGFLFTILSKCHAKLKNTGSLFLHMANQYDTQTGFMDSLPQEMVIALRRSGWHFMRELIWHRTEQLTNSFYKTWRNDVEHIYWFVKSSDYYFVNTICGGSSNIVHGDTCIVDAPVIFEPCKLCKGHDIIFPDVVIEKCILNTTPAGGIVLDPLCGLAATTGVVALNHGLRFIGIELDTEKAIQAIQRLKKVS